MNQPRAIFYCMCVFMRAEGSCVAAAIVTVYLEQSLLTVAGMSHCSITSILHNLFGVNSGCLARQCLVITQSGHTTSMQYVYSNIVAA